MMWWGYIHTNSSLQVKRFFDYEDLSEARQSSFVKKVYGPWKVHSRDEALEALKKSAEE